MRYTSQINIKNRQTIKRLSALVFLSCFVFLVSIFLETVIIAHTNHEHDRNGAHGSCAACAQIQSAENLLKQLGVIAGGMISAFAAVFAAVIIFRSVYSPIGFLTLTDLKIRMNN